MKLNLQFFADGEDVAVSTGVEVSEPAAPMETVGESVTSDVEEISQAEQPTEEPKPVDANAIAASVRRSMEKEFEAKREKEQAARDAEYVRMFGEYKNPRTGKPISGERDYFDAIASQKLVNAGVNVSELDNYINNDPRIKQAEEVMKRAQEAELMNNIQRDVAEIGKIDPSIKVLEDIPSEIVQYATDNHYTLLNAYKLMTYDKVSAKNAEAIRQSAVNQIKGKQHLAPMNGVATNDSEVEIPTEERVLWETIFPNKTYAERRTLYNKQLK